MWSLPWGERKDASAQLTTQQTAWTFRLSAGGGVHIRLFLTATIVSLKVSIRSSTDFTVKGDDCQAIQ
jgi:hypothetical protein